MTAGVIPTAWERYVDRLAAEDRPVFARDLELFLARHNAGTLYPFKAPTTGKLRRVGTKVVRT